MSALFEPAGILDASGVLWAIGTSADANPLLSQHHYLGPIESGGYELIVIGLESSEVVAAQVWRRPTSRHLPPDGTWLELSRWCLTAAAGLNAGSRQHRHALRIIRQTLPDVTTLVSYSDPSRGHTGALYRACNWVWRPTWLRLRPPPSGNGAWVKGKPQSVKDRWIFEVRPDPSREAVLCIDSHPGAIRFWLATASGPERKWGASHPQLAKAAS